MSALQAITLASVWKEVDPRLTRFVKVWAIGVGSTPEASGAAPIRSGFITLCSVTPDTHEPIPGRRLTYAKQERFNGKRGGYALHCV